ncbi:MAG: DUF1592 domain-containing protein [Myxococcales bacterium]|nr:DUF1592 domain-containing protein [Myxococcales bacterium]
MSRPSTRRLARWALAAMLLGGCADGALTTALDDPEGPVAPGAGGAPFDPTPPDPAARDAGARGPADDATAPPAADAGPPSPPGNDLPPFAPQAPTLHRLTLAQYRNSVRDLLGDVQVPADLEVDTPLHGFASVGASELTISPRAAEQYEAAALDLAAQALSADRRAAFTGCDAPDAACTDAFLADFARLAWRRPISPDEATLLSTLAADVGATLGDAWGGVQHAVAFVLQSPDFLFRVEVGEPDPDRPGGRRFTDHEMAARLAYLLWNTTPDADLLAAADRGELTTDAGLRAQAERLLADDRARDALRRYFAEYFNLDRLDALEKDRELFPQMSETLGASMKAEILALIDHIVFEADADFRDLLVTRDTFINDELAALYFLPPVGADAPTPVTLPADGPRAGLLTTAGVLALNAHNTVTSPTHRGKFIQNYLLCYDIPPPPPGVATSLDGVEVEGPVTTRQKLARHRSDPTCNACHRHMDPLGLALENFDAIGAWRTTESGLPIDASGELYGETFVGGLELAALLRNQDAIAECVARRLYRHANGRLEARSEQIAVRDLTEAFVEGGHRLQTLMVALVLSDGFRTTGEVER